MWSLNVLLNKLLNGGDNEPEYNYKSPLRNDKSKKEVLVQSHFINVGPFVPISVLVLLILFLTLVLVIKPWIWYRSRILNKHAHGIVASFVF